MNESKDETVIRKAIGKKDAGVVKSLRKQFVAPEERDIDPQMVLEYMAAQHPELDAEAVRAKAVQVGLIAGGPLDIQDSLDDLFVQTRLNPRERAEARKKQRKAEKRKK